MRGAQLPGASWSECGHVVIPVLAFAFPSRVLLALCDSSCGR